MMRSNLASALLVLVVILSTRSAQAEPAPVGEIIYYDFSPEGGEPRQGEALTGGAVVVERRDSIKGLAVLGVPLASPESVLDGISSVATIINNGPSNNRVDLVIMGDGYAAHEQEQFNFEVQRLVDALFEREPFKQYRRYFNVHRVNLISADSGVDFDPQTYPNYDPRNRETIYDPATIAAMQRDTVVDSQYWCQNLQRLICTNTDKVRLVANQAPGADQIVVLVNSSTYGGAGYVAEDIATIPGGYWNVIFPLQTASTAAEILAHELGHTFANLCDEYAYNYDNVYQGPERVCPNISIYDSNEMEARKTKWWSWLGENFGKEFAGLVDTFVGGDVGGRGVYRPTETSKMMALGNPYNLPSLQAFVLEIYKLVSPLNKVHPQQQIVDESEVLLAQPLIVEGRSLQLSWYVDGELLTGYSRIFISPEDLDLTQGTHTIKAVVQDDSPFVRPSALKMDRLRAEHEWQIIVMEKAAPQLIKEPRDSTVVVGEAVELDCEVIGTAPLSISWFKNGQRVDGAVDRQLSFRADLENDGDQYFCLAVNEYGRVQSRVATITIASSPTPPIIVQHPQDQEVRQNSSARFICEAIGAGAINYTWFKNGVEVPGLSGPELVVKAYRSNHGMQVNCRANNAAGNIISRSARLWLAGLEHISFILGPQDTTILEGDRVELTCAATGPQEMGLQWFRNGWPIAEATSERYQLQATATDDGAIFHCMAGLEGELVVPSDKGKLRVVTASPGVRMDFNGDGCSDLVLEKTNSDAKALVPVEIWYMGSNDSSQFDRISSELNQVYPVFGDYDGDGLWDLAKVEVNGRNLRWSIKASAGLMTHEINFGEPGDRILTGCNLGGSGAHDLALLRGRRLVATTGYGDMLAIDLILPVRSRLASTQCADLNGDGLSEVVVLERRWVRRANNTIKRFQLVAYDLAGNKVLRKQSKNLAQVLTLDIDGDGQDEVGIRWRNGKRTVFKLYALGGRPVGRWLLPNLGDAMVIEGCGGHPKLVQQGRGRTVVTSLIDRSRSKLFRLENNRLLNRVVAKRIR